MCWGACLWHTTCVEDNLQFFPSTMWFLETTLIFRLGGSHLYLCMSHLVSCPPLLSPPLHFWNNPEALVSCPDLLNAGITCVCHHIQVFFFHIDLSVYHFSWSHSCLFLDLTIKVKKNFCLVNLLWGFSERQFFDLFFPLWVIHNFYFGVHVCFCLSLINFVSKNWNLALLE